MRTHDERNNGLREHSAFHLHPHPIKEQRRTETQPPPTVQTARPPRFIHSLMKGEEEQEKRIERKKRREDKTRRAQNSQHKLVGIVAHTKDFQRERKKYLKLCGIIYMIHCIYTHTYLLYLLLYLCAFWHPKIYLVIH